MNTTRPPSRRHRLLSHLVVASTALALVACGDDDPAEPATDTEVDGTDTATDVADTGADAPADAPDATDVPASDPPTVAFDEPAEGTCVDESVELLATATDDDAVESVTFFAGDDEIGTADSEPFSVQWDATGVADGSATLRAVATDSDGLEASAELEVVVDHTAPEIVIEFPGADDDPPAFRDVLPVALALSDAGGVVAVSITLSSAETVIAPTILDEEPWEADLDVTDLHGDWTLTIEATDCAGHVATATAQVLLTSEACDADEDFALSIECGGIDCDDEDSEFTANECGGCEEIPAEVGAPCGSCGSGSWACDGGDAVVCEGDAGDEARNACGGCIELAETPGGDCDSCGDETCVLACSDPDLIACVSAETPEGFVRIEPGTFTMGSPVGEVGRRGGEEQHEVTLTRAYNMAIDEVTQVAWEERTGTNPAFFPGCDDCPIETINWWEAMHYANLISEEEGLTPCFELLGCIGEAGTGMVCESAILAAATPYDCEGYRLPTEAEFEYAARAGTTGATYIGEMEDATCDGTDLDEIAWTCSNTVSTRPVGMLDPNPWGLYDILGNVYELTLDWYGDYPEGPVTDPVGPDSGTFRAVRGGGWDFRPGDSRSARRVREDPTAGGDHVGLRLVRTAP